MNDADKIFAYLSDSKKQPQQPMSFEDAYLGTLKGGAIYGTRAAIMGLTDIGMRELYESTGHGGVKEAPSFRPMPQKRFSLTTGLAIGGAAFAGILVIIWALKK